jgi:hypothetical protein
MAATKRGELMHAKDQLRLGHARLPGHLAWFALALLVAACSVPTGSPTLDPATICDGIAAEFGGCSPDRPNYTSTTCADLAAEWGRDVDRRIISVIGGPRDADGKAKSVRNTDVLVLTSLVLTMRLDALGMRPDCNMAEFWPIAEEQLSDAVKAEAGSIMWDGDPVVPFDAWLTRAQEIVRMIDDPLPGDSTTGSAASP